MADTTVPPLKRCSKCGNDYPATTEYFHKRNDTPCGLKGKCIQCCKRDYDPKARSEKGKRYYETNRASVKAKSKNRYYADPAKAQQAHQAYYKAHKPDHRKRSHEYRRAHPEKAKAHQVVAKAVQRGKLPRASSLQCVVCGQPANHYHHESYDQMHRLDVVPMCSKCHGKTWRKAE